jgi:hypothetical protein
MTTEIAERRLVIPLVLHPLHLHRIADNLAPPQPRTINVRRQLVGLVPVIHESKRGRGCRIFFY